MLEIDNKTRMDLERIAKALEGIDSSLKQIVSPSQTSNPQAKGLLDLLRSISISVGRLEK